MIDIVAEDADRLNLVIIGLLVVAALLAGLTVWYWRHTDPRRTLTASSVRRSEPATPAPTAPMTANPVRHTISPTGATSAPIATGRPAPAEVPRRRADDVLTNDEWDALTGPATRPADRAAQEQR